MKCLTPFLFAVLFFTIKVNAQNTGTIKGTVVTSNETPIENVTVSSTESGFKVTTNAQGEFTVTNVQTGKITLVLTHVGYTTSSVTVTVKQQGVTVMPKVMSCTP